MKRSFKTPDERRKYARLDMRSKIDFTVTDSGKDAVPSHVFQAIGKNIGVEGIRISTDQKINVGDLLDLTILFPFKTEPVTIQGEVRWCTPIKHADNPELEDMFEAGVKFISIEKAHVLLLVKQVCGNLGKDILKNITKQ